MQFNKLSINPEVFKVFEETRKSLAKISSVMKPFRIKPNPALLKLQEDVRETRKSLAKMVSGIKPFRIKPNPALLKFLEEISETRKSFSKIVAWY